MYAYRMYNDATGIILLFTVLAASITAIVVAVTLSIGEGFSLRPFWRELVSLVVFALVAVGGLWVLS